jgi:hypothetical protein
MDYIKNVIFSTPVKNVILSIPVKYVILSRPVNRYLISLVSSYVGSAMKKTVIYTVKTAYTTIVRK